MTVSNDTCQGLENSDAIADLLARNRAKVVRTGETIDALIAQYLKEGNFFALKSSVTGSSMLVNCYLQIEFHKKIRVSKTERRAPVLD